MKMKQYAFLIKMEVPEGVPDMIVIESIDKNWPTKWRLLSAESSGKIRAMAGVKEQ